MSGFMVPPVDLGDAAGVGAPAASSAGEESGSCGPGAPGEPVNAVEAAPAPSPADWCEGSSAALDSKDTAI